MTADPAWLEQLKAAVQAVYERPHVVRFEATHDTYAHILTTAEAFAPWEMAYPSDQIRGVPLVVSDDLPDGLIRAYYSNGATLDITPERTHP